MEDFFIEAVSKLEMQGIEFELHEDFCIVVFPREKRSGDGVVLPSQIEHLKAEYGCSVKTPSMTAGCPRVPRSWLTVHKNVTMRGPDPHSYLLQEATLKAIEYVEKNATAAEPPPKKARVDRGNMEMECGVCNERSTMQALVPCGHLVCQSCSSKPEVTKKCPFCKQPTIGTQVLFKP